MQIRRHIPNIITAGNLLFGALAIFFALTGHLSWAPWCIMISAILDFLDGFAARMLGVSGELGKQLDSLADMVTFGLAPGIIMVLLINYGIAHDIQKDKVRISENAEMLEEGSIRDNYISDAPDLLILNSVYNHSRAMHFNKGLEKTSENNGKEETPAWMAYLPFVGLLIPILSLFRLAKFNLDTRQSSGFLGLPTPANTIFFAGLALIFQSYMSNYNLPSWQENLALILLDYRILIAFSVFFSILLVTEIPMFSLKVKGFGWKGNEMRYSFLILSIILIIGLKMWSLPFIIILYILMSVVGILFAPKAKN